jgi:hypothetical protein
LRNKKWISLIITLTLMCTMVCGGFVTAAAGANGFKDTGAHWAKADIDEMVAKGIVQGYSADNTFRPDNTITRAEFVTLVNRAFQFTTPATTQFTDVAPADWYAQQVSCAVAAGYIQGFGDGTFKPQNLITRQEVFTMIARVLKLDLSSDNTILQRFQDGAQIPEWSRGAIIALLEKGLITAYPDNTLRFAQNMTRGESVVFLKRSMAAEPGVTPLKDSRVFDAAGFFDGQNAVIDGNVTVTARDVSLKNWIINGDLIIDSSVGNGTVSLRNVQVKGTIYVRGGSIIEMNGNAPSVKVESKDTTFKLFSGTIDLFEAAAPASDCTLYVASGATVKKVILNSLTRLTGSGLIVLAQVNADGSTRSPNINIQTVQYAPGVTELKISTAGTGGGGGGSSGGGTGGTGGTGDTPTYPLQTPGIVAGSASFDNATTLSGLPDGVDVSGSRIDVAAQDGITQTGIPMDISIEGLSPDQQAAGIIIKMPTSSSASVLGYCNNDRWEIVPGSQAVKENGKWYVIGRVDHFSIYAPLKLTAQLIADSITGTDATIGNPVPAQYLTSFIYPTVPSGCTISIKSSSNSSAIKTDGTVHLAGSAQQSNVVFTVNYNGSAESQEVTVRVLASSKAGAAKDARSALIAFHQALAEISYSTDVNQLKTNLQAFEVGQTDTLQTLVGADKTVSDFYDLALATKAEMMNIMSNDRARLVSLKNASEKELQDQISIWTILALQNVCANSGYSWFTNAMDNLGWTLAQAAAQQDVLANLVDPNMAARKALTLGYIRANTLLTAGSCGLSNTSSTEFKLSILGHSYGNAAATLFDWYSSNSALAAFDFPFSELTAKASGDITVTARRADSSDPQDYVLQFKVGINQAEPGIYTDSLYNALEGESYKKQLLAYGGDGSYVWTIASGALPAGMTLSSSGILSGIPTETGSFSFDVKVSSNDQETTGNYSLQVSANEGRGDKLAYILGQIYYYLDTVEKTSINNARSATQTLTEIEWNTVVNPLLTSEVINKY